MKKEKSVRQKEFKEAVIRQLKSLTAPVIITAVIAVAIVVIFYFQAATEQEPVVELNGYSGSQDPIVVENDSLKLTMDPVTTQITLEVKETGKIWYSNPPAAAEDPLAVASYKGRLQSTLLLTFSQATGLQTTFDNFSYGIDNQLYEIEQGDDYIKVNYSTEDQSAIFNSWSAFLNYFDASIPFQTHLYQPPQSLRRAVQDQHPPVHDNFDSIRASPLER